MIEQLGEDAENFWGLPEAVVQARDLAADARSAVVQRFQTQADVRYANLSKAACEARSNTRSNLRLGGPTPGPAAAEEDNAQAASDADASDSTGDGWQQEYGAPWSECKVGSLAVVKKNFDNGFCGIQLVKVVVDGGVRVRVSACCAMCGVHVV